MDRIEPTFELLSEAELDRLVAKYDQLIEREERLAELIAEREDMDDDRYVDRRGSAQKLADDAAEYAQARVIMYALVVFGMFIWYGAIELYNTIAGFLGSF